MSLGSKISEAPRDKLRCAIIALDLKTGKTRSLDVWCRSFYEVYGTLMRENLRLITYTIL